jgi:hypothetical protein
MVFAAAQPQHDDDHGDALTVDRGSLSSSLLIYGMESSIMGRRRRKRETKMSRTAATLLRVCTLWMLLAWHQTPFVYGQQQQAQSKTSVIAQGGECHLGETGACSHPPHQKHALKETSANHNNHCTIYLAPSTIPHAGLGIFTTVPKSKGDLIGQGDVFLPLFEMDWHNDKGKKAPSGNETAYVTYFNPFSDYVWTGESMGMSTEVESTDVHAMCPGLDAAINCNLALLNVGKALPVWDDGGLHRSRDPGAGALTPYHNGTTPILYRDIPAGGELFKFYGDSWFQTRPDWFQNLPLSEDYPRAQHLLDAFGRLIGIGKQQQPTSSTNNASSSPTLFRLTVEMQRDIWKMVSNLPFPSRTMNALPKKLEDAWIAIQDELAALYQPFAIRSQAFLEEYGKCFDHIRPGRSTLFQAGRGGFAVRPLAKGSIISGSPLLHLPHYKVFHIYEFQHDPAVGTWVRTEKVIGQQIMLNYCFGHAQTTLLLCPYGAGVPYINHNQTLANVRVQWSKHGLTSQNDSWFNMTPPEMEWLYKPNLGMDYIALRDIAEGEELFMDYGEEFEAAWQQHVANWKPLANSQTYSSAYDFNLRMWETPLRTEREQEWDPYPKHLQIRCHSVLSDHNWRQRIPKHPPKHAMWPLNEKGHACRILQRVHEEGNVDLYEVLVIDEEVGTQYTRSGVQRHAIAFVDKPYTTDMHLPNAFRFPIMIPDDMVPEAWRNAELHNYKTK